MNFYGKIKKAFTATLAVATVLSLAACSSQATPASAGTTTTSTTSTTAASQSTSSNDPIVMVWYPNESAGDYAPAREEFGRLIEQATGRKVEQKLTTDYAIAIESIANGSASIAFMGAQGYIEANNKSADVKPLFVNSGASGTLDDAIYYSFLNVLEGNETQYMNNSQFTLDNIVGKRMSFVSNSSTSGFKVPTSDIIAYFSKTSEWKNLTADDLIEGGSGMFFSEVLFGGSHQGSGVNLFTEKADIAAFCDTEIAPYADLFSGTEARPGAVYQIKADASAPFDVYAGEKFVVIKSTPVLNGPFAYNTNTLSDEEVAAIIELFTSDEVTNNDKIFIASGSGNVGMFKKTANEKVVAVTDDWYNPIRELSN